MKERIKEWYMKKYPTDNMGKHLGDATFGDIYELIMSGKGECFYEMLGAGDSLIRERCFEHLSELTGFDYRFIYDHWLGVA